MKYIAIDKLNSLIEAKLEDLGMSGSVWVGRSVLNELKEDIKSLQQEQPTMIQWTGNNLKEVIDFTGKSPRFEEWFKSWEEYENYVHSHNDILKLFCEDGSHYEVPVGAWIVKTPDGYNVPSVARFIHAKQEQPEDMEKKQKPVVQWPNLSNCKHNCKTCFAKCFYRKEQNEEQKPTEWSEEDKTNGWTGVDLERYLSCLQRLGTGNPQQPETINSKWFKEHCRFQPHWEPSEEQMRCLLDCVSKAKEIHNASVGGYDAYRILVSLYDELHKLL